MFFHLLPIKVLHLELKTPTSDAPDGIMCLDHIRFWFSMVICPTLTQQIKRFLWSTPLDAGQGGRRPSLTFSNGLGFLWRKTAEAS